MDIKPSSPNGLLFWVAEPGHFLSREMGGQQELEGEGEGDHQPLFELDYLAVGLKDGYVQFGFDLGSGGALATINTTHVDDNHWHSVRVHRSEIGYMFTLQ